MVTPSLSQRFTQRARRVLSGAEKEASSLNKPYTGPEHIFLALIDDPESVAGKTFKELNIDLESARRAVMELSDEGSSKTITGKERNINTGDKQVLELAAEEAERLGHHYIGTEHLLLGLLRINYGMIPALLEKLDISPVNTRKSIRKILNEGAISKAVQSKSFELDLIPYLLYQRKSERDEGLAIEIETLKSQIRELEEETKSSRTTEQIEKLASTVENIEKRGEELSAPIVLPPMEDMNVRLVPSHSLERLEEYRSDESIAYLLIGLFGGAILGILVNWVTTENIVITRFSVVFIILLGLLMLFCILWARQLRERTNIIRQKLLRPKEISEP